MLEFFLSSPRPELQSEDREEARTESAGTVVNVPGRGEIHLVNMGRKVSTTGYWAAVPGGKFTINSTKIHIQHQ